MNLSNGMVEKKVPKGDKTVKNNHKYVFLGLYIDAIKLSNYTRKVKK